MPKFTTAFNGFAGFVKESDMEKLKEIPGVKNVYISQEYERPRTDMNSSGGMVKAGETWDIGYKGEGMVVAVIDTGIDPSHRDMVLSETTIPKLDEEKVNSIKNGEETSVKVLPSRSVIIGKKAYDIDYLNKNVNAQKELVEELKIKNPYM